MIYNKDFRDIIKNLNKEKTIIITDPPYNVGWKYDTYKDKVSEDDYNSNMGKQHRSIAFFNCKPDFNKAKQLPKNPTDKRVNSEVKLYDWWLINLVKNVSKEKEDYSNQIPEQVIGNIIKIVANKDDVIFDPFMGSGTTPAVSSKLGYKYIATDISKKAYNITSKRLNKIENNLFTI